MTKHLLKKTTTLKEHPAPDKLLSELMPEMRQHLRSASRDLMQPRQEAINEILRKAAEMTSVSH